MLNWPWQDIVFTVGSWIFIFALVPSIMGSNKPAFSTSLTTGLVLATYVAAYLSLDLVFSAVSTLILASAWLFLGWQKRPSN